MIGVHARYRGSGKRRADVVARSAKALEALPGVGEFEALGVEDIRAEVDSPEHALNVVMALLSDGDWAIGLGITAGGPALEAATTAVDERPGHVGVVVQSSTAGTAAEDIAAAFELLSYVLSKRTVSGREATGLVRRGMNQNQAARELGITRQAMHQRLLSAAWEVEQAGWRLALNLITQAEEA